MIKNGINRVNNDGIMFYIIPNLTRFVALYDGIAYWFMMKDQYLFNVSTEQEFFAYIGNPDTPEKMRFTPTNTGFVSRRGLMAKARYYAAHPVNKEGQERNGIDLLRETYGEDI